MANTNDLQTAIGEISLARYKAAVRKKEAGNPRNPFKALPGREEEFYSAAQSVRQYDLILKLLEKEARREIKVEVKRIKVKISRILDRALDFYVGAGIVALATLGFAAAFQLMNAPSPVTQAAAIIGVCVALARAVARK